MSRKTVNAICRKFPGAEVSDPWGGGHDAWKVGGKVFACIGAVIPGVSVKTDSIETAQMLIDAGVGVKAPYFHRLWVNLPWGTSATTASLPWLLMQRQQRTINGRSACRQCARMPSLSENRPCFVAIQRHCVVDIQVDCGGRGRN